MLLHIPPVKRKNKHNFGPLLEIQPQFPSSSGPLEAAWGLPRQAEPRLRQAQRGEVIAGIPMARQQDLRHAGSGAGRGTGSGHGAEAVRPGAVLMH